MSDDVDPAEAPPTIIGVPPDTPDLARPSATGLVVDPAAQEDAAAVEAGGRVVGGDGHPEVEGPNSE
jgi:hypothetical protein